jgi:peptide/nickel transport system substrate-binding protein
LLLKALYSPEAFDREKRKQIYKEWTELYANEVPIIFLYSQNRIEVYNKRIEGVKPSWNGIVENLGIIDWKIKK